MLEDDTEEGTVNLERQGGRLKSVNDSVQARENVWTRPVLHSSESIYCQCPLGEYGAA